MTVVYKRQRPHIVDVTWATYGGELDPIVTIACPYDADDHDKPCRIWADESGETFEDGCWVEQELDALSWRDMSFALPPGWSRPPWRMMVHGSGDEGPQLTEVSESYIPRHRWWHRRR